jgi:SPOR domain
VRAVFFLLLFANLAFLAWAEWIDVPQPVPANDVYAKLPRLRLINEQPGDENRPSSGSARKTALQAPPPVSRCLSIGPFDDQASATRGASLLREKGMTPRQRAEQGEISKGYWVYIGGLTTEREVAEVLHTLEQSHVEDAHLMPDTGDTHRVSVGLFSERDRAARRAQSVQKLGLQPEVSERKLPATVFWMDVDLPPGTTSLTAKDAAGEGASPSSRVEVTPCPDEPSRPDGAAPLPAAPGTTTTFRTKVASGAGASKVP